MDLGWWASVIIGIGVAGHAVVATVLGTRLHRPTRPLWSRFGSRPGLIRFNGLLLVLAASLHFAVSLVKAVGSPTEVFWSSLAPFPFYAAAGVLAVRGDNGWFHHALLTLGWLAFAWHASVAT